MRDGIEATEALAEEALVPDAHALGPADVAAPATTPAAPGMTPARPSSLFKNREFKIFLGGQSVSAVGDAVTFTALPLLVLALTGSGVAMGLVGILATLPDLIFGLPAGALADRWDRRKMMLFADLGRGILTALIPLSVILGLDTMTVILIVTAPINLLRVLFLAGFTTAVPNLVERDQIGRANGLVEAIFSASFIVGPAIAGTLVSRIGAGPTLAIDAATFLISALALTFIRLPLRPAAGDGTQRRHLLAEIREGVVFILREPTLRTVIAFWGATSVVTASLVTGVIYFLSKDLGRDEAFVGNVLAGFGVGYLAGALLASRFARGRLGRLMLAANIATGSMLVLFAIGDQPILEFIGAAGAGVFSALVLIPYVTLRATIPPDELLGRVGSTARTISLGLQPIGLLIGGVLLDAIGGQKTLLGIAAVTIAITVAFAFVPAMRNAVAGSGRRTAPA